MFFELLGYTITVIATSSTTTVANGRDSIFNFQLIRASAERTNTSYNLGG